MNGCGKYNYCDSGGDCCFGKRWKRAPAKPRSGGAVADNRQITTSRCKTAIFEAIRTSNKEKLDQKKTLAARIDAV